MPPETKRLFDQLTEDAMKLLGNGEYSKFHHWIEDAFPQIGQ